MSKKSSLIKKKKIPSPPTIPVLYFFSDLKNNLKHIFDFLQVPLPSDPSLFEYFFDTKTLQWTHITTLSHTVFPSTVSTPRSGIQILTPTPRLLTCAFAMQKAINGNSNVLLIGPWSAGKSALIQHVTNSGWIKTAESDTYAPNACPAFCEAEGIQNHTYQIPLLITRHMNASRYGCRVFSIAPQNLNAAEFFRASVA